VFTKYSRDAETEADMVGAQIMYDAGFDPRAMVAFFQKLKEQQGEASGPSFLASHPDPGNRARNVASILSRFPPKEFQEKDSSDFLAAKIELNMIGPVKVPAVELPATGLRRLSAKELAPGDFVSYDHEGFEMAYPGNWQVGGNPNSSLTLYPNGGADPQTITYGTIISGFTPSRGAKQMDEAMQQLIASIRETNPGLRQAGNPVNISVGGKPAKSVEMLGTSAIREKGQPLAERIRLVAQQGKGNVVLYMVFIAPDADFDGLRPTFDRIMRSFTQR
jgi:hypothetical protein